MPASSECIALSTKKNFVLVWIFPGLSQYRTENENCRMITRQKLAIYLQCSKFAGCWSKKFFFRNFSKYICWLMDFPENEKLICLIFKTLNCSKTNIFQRSYWTLTFRELWKFEPNICNYFIYFCQFLSLRIKLFENQIYFSQYCSNLTQEHIKNALIVANTKLTFDLSQIVREMNHQIS